jgi:hypothetical protein
MIEEYIVSPFKEQKDIPGKLGCHPTRTASFTVPSFCVGPLFVGHSIIGYSSAQERQFGLFNVLVILGDSHMKIPRFLF